MKELQLSSTAEIVADVLGSELKKMKKRKIGLIATAVIAAMILVTPTVLATVAPELKMPFEPEIDKFLASVIFKLLNLRITKE